jgi:hypothetical protein
MARRTEALKRMVDRGLTHYDDVFDLIDVYYQQDWQAFSDAIDVWVPINTD